MNHLKTLPYLTVQILNDSTYMGSAVLVKVEDTFYVLTAAHVPFGKDSSQYNKGLSSTLTYRSESFGDLKFVRELGNIDIYKNQDIFSAEVAAPDISCENFPEIMFTSDTDFPELDFLFRGRAKSVSKIIYTVQPCKKNGTTASEIHLEIPTKYYTDFKR